MARNPDGSASCDGCGRVFSPDLPPAELSDHRDYCGTCKRNRENDYEVEAQGRHVMSSALRADPHLLDLTPPAEQVAEAAVEVSDEQPTRRRRLDPDRDN